MSSSFSHIVSPVFQVVSISILSFTFSCFDKSMIFRLDIASLSDILLESEFIDVLKSVSSLTGVVVLVSSIITSLKRWFIGTQESGLIELCLIRPLLSSLLFSLVSDIVGLLLFVVVVSPSIGFGYGPLFSFVLEATQQVYTIVT